MQSNSNNTTRLVFPSLEEDMLNIHSPEFQQGYRDAYTRESLQSEHPDYLVGYMYGSKDRVLYRDC